MATNTSKQIDMSGFKLKPELIIGCCRFARADSFPLSEIYTHHSKSETTIRFSGSENFVVVYMFKRPYGNKEFERLQEFFGEDRISRVRLPEGVPFHDDLLLIKDMPPGWRHSAFARSGRDLFSVYESKRLAVFVRYHGKKSTSTLGDPLIRSIRRNLRIVDDQWVMAFPDIDPRREHAAKSKSKGLNPATHAELRDAIARARGRMKLTAKSSARQAIDAIHDRVEQMRRGKTTARELEDEAIDLGALWGDALCKAEHWRWQGVVEKKGEEAVIAVVSERNRFAVAPLVLIHGILKSKRVVNNAKLLFNMICADAMGEVADNSYRWLS